MRFCGGVSFESSVDDSSACVVEVWHNWLTHGSIPRHVSWLSVPVPVDILMVLVENRSLQGPPLQASISGVGVLCDDLAQTPVEEVGVVLEWPHEEFMVVEHGGSLGEESSAHVLHQEVKHIEMHDPRPNVKRLHGQLPDQQVAKSHSEFASLGVGSLVEVTLAGRSRKELVESVLPEPTLHDGDFPLSLLREPAVGSFSHLVGGQPKTQKLIVLNVLSGLVVDLPPLQVVISVYSEKSNGKESYLAPPGT